MPIKFNQNVNNIKVDLYNNNLKTYSGYYANNWNFTLNLSLNLSWSSLAINEDGFIVATPNGTTQTTFGYSTDGGINWNSTTVPSGNWKSIAYSKDFKRFVAIGYGIIIYSNIKNPTSTGHWVTVSGVPNIQFEKIISGDNLFIAISSSGTSDFLFKRILILWFNQNNTLNFRSDRIPLQLIEQYSTNAWKTLCYGNGVYIAAPNNSATNNPIIYSNDDGNNWFVANNHDSQVLIVNSQTVWSDCAYSSKLNLFIMIAVSGTYRLVFSEDGKKWRNDIVSTFVNNFGWSSIVWSQELELFIAVENVTSNQKIITSNDGKNWTLRRYNADKIVSSIIWNRYHGNFIATSSATASTNNIFITKPLGINSFLNEEQYYNKTKITNFKYTTDKKYYIAPFGILPEININIHNEYSIDGEDFPSNSGLKLNNKNGVIVSNGTSTIIETSIKRIIKVYNRATLEQKTTEVEIIFQSGDVKLEPGDFSYIAGSTSSIQEIELEGSNPNEDIPILKPDIKIVGYYLFKLTGTLFKGLNFNSSTGEIYGKINADENASSTSLSITVFSKEFDEEETITLTLKLKRSYIISPQPYGATENLPSETSVASAEIINGIIQIATGPGPNEFTKVFGKDVAKFLGILRPPANPILALCYLLVINQITRIRLINTYTANLTGHALFGQKFYFNLPYKNLNNNHTIKNGNSNLGIIALDIFKTLKIKAIFKAQVFIPDIQGDKFPNTPYYNNNGAQSRSGKDFYIYFDGDQTNNNQLFTTLTHNNQIFSYGDFEKTYDQDANSTIFYKLNISQEVFDRIRFRDDYPFVFR